MLVGGSSSLSSLRARTVVFEARIQGTNTSNPAPLRAKPSRLTELPVQYTGLSNHILIDSQSVPILPVAQHSMSTWLWQPFPAPDIPIPYVAIFVVT
jgi:hypothetical protein